MQGVYGYGLMNKNYRPMNQLERFLKENGVFESFRDNFLFCSTKKKFRDRDNLPYPTEEEFQLFLITFESSGMAIKYAFEIKEDNADKWLAIHYKWLYHLDLLNILESSNIIFS
jgi:hypothetical protein